MICGVHALLERGFALECQAGDFDFGNGFGQHALEVLQDAGIVVVDGAHAQIRIGGVDRQVVGGAPHLQDVVDEPDVLAELVAPLGLVDLSGHASSPNCWVGGSCSAAFTALNYISIKTIKCQYGLKS